MLNRSTGKNRPEWAEGLRLWLTDGQFDHLEAVNARDWRWTWHAWLQAAGLATLCFVFGHKAVRDHCNKPEHDSCAYCDKTTPGKAERP